MTKSLRKPLERFTVETTIIVKTRDTIVTDALTHGHLEPFIEVVAPKDGVVPR